jgi:hypothetical protein
MTPTAYTLSRRDKLLGVDNISVKIVRSSSDADRCGSWVGTRADSRGAMSAWRGILEAVYEPPAVIYANCGHATRRPLSFPVLGRQIPPGTHI